MVFSQINPAGCNPAIITKADKDFSKRFDFKDIKIPVKTRDIEKTEKKKSISISVFFHNNREKNPLYASKKCCEDKHVDLLLIGKKQKTLCFYQKL